MTADHPRVDTGWDVRIVWLTRRLRRPDRMARDRFAASRRRRSAAPARHTPTPGRVRSESSPDDGARRWSVLDIFTDELGLIAMVVVVGFLLGPLLLGFAVIAAEITILLAVAALAPIVRVLLGQPWEVVARGPGTTLNWRTRGVRNARGLVDEIEAAIRLGVDPADVRPEWRDPDPPAMDTIPGFYGSDGFRLLGIVFGVALAAGLGLVAILFWIAVSG